MEDYRKIAIELGHTLISKAPETREDVERMLPELREESEDERIRKALINGLKRYDDGTLFNGCLVREILAWLEKQCEQKPTDKIEPKFKVGDRINQVGRSNEPCYILTVTTVDTDIKCYVCHQATVIEFKEQDQWQLVEQKPADCYYVPSREMVLNVWELGNLWKELTGGSMSTEHGTQLDYVIKHWSEGDYYKEIEQKPAWSEEDLNKYDFAIRAIGLCKQYAINNQINGYSKLPDTPQRYEELLSWFKSLKDRVQPQPKQEWSEEDEDKMQIIINIIKDSDPDWEELINWLKSLRHQNTWKPSDEQMEALDFAADCIVPAEFFYKRRMLKELLEQLKKLKDEK